jgi:hypothetical protein
MTLFIRLLDAENKAAAMAAAVATVRKGCAHPRVFEVNPESFAQVPGSPFAYWVSEAVRRFFTDLPAFEGEGRTAKLGGSTKNDFRFLRVWWEIGSTYNLAKWFPFAKGGAYSPFHADIHLLISWENNAREIEAELLLKFPYLGKSADFVLHRNHPYFRPGLTWPRRTSSGLSMRVMPKNCIFADKGPAAFVQDDDPENLLALLAITNSTAFKYLVGLQLAAADAAARSYEVGVIQRTPLPEIPDATHQQLAQKARRAWSIQRQLDTTNETSHAFVLPALLRARLGNWNPDAFKVELQQIQADIDAIAFDLYGFSPENREAVARLNTAVPDAETPEEDEEAA